MSDFFLELLSEEIPPKLQINARTKIKDSLEQNLSKRMIKFKSSKAFSTPQRLVFLITGLPEKIEQEGRLLKGPKVGVPKAALDGFLKSNNLKLNDVFEKQIDKGNFYFTKTQNQKINVLEELQIILPQILNDYSWEKSMRWSNFDLKWARPLRSILSIFNKKVLKFKFFHIQSDSFTFYIKNCEEKHVKVKDFNSYLKFLKSKKIILDQEKRKKIIIDKFNKFCESRNLQKNYNQRLMDEVTNLVENPHIIIGQFDENFLKIPSEILTLTMERHQRYFPLFDKKNKLTNLFFFVSNLQDKKGLIKSGNERVIEARLADAKFFWEKNKTQNLVKQISKLQNISFFNKLGSLYDKSQRMRKLGSFVSENLNLNKEKIEIAASICKADLNSDLVGEYPELQGVMGGYFAKSQGFEDDVSLAVKEHYLPIGINSPVPKKAISYTVALVDKLDTLVGFFGIKEIPTSSKDPFALRRSAIGLLRIIIENNLKIKIKDYLNYSKNLYLEQGVKFSNEEMEKNILFFLKERIKNIFKEKKIRQDIIEAGISSHTSDNFLSLYKKCFFMNKIINNQTGENIISTYKRVANILEQETKNEVEKISDQPDSILFVKAEEKLLLDKINEIRVNFISASKDENYDNFTQVLSDTKATIDTFFENVVVNDEDINIKKNRLKLLQMFCNTYDNFINFSKIEGL
ncbi:MAG: glycine--tRNA ligase subunit beta [Candidatus Pelagibacter sp. TMED64]|nr:glycine--tRNA ligase subunit beta [Candidatus Pelagibacter sp.]OUU65836.1 MAG: glycine--tRNA ligase subunit beta [Candidatus Pelagibacter sp. TMED64]|tara:strand:- start:6558 stop:8624 length:2067 start_codon:yes stop_codon:yes gene_type:complete